MFRYLVAHLPCFRLERCGWAAHQPVALLAEERSALRVQCATPVATRSGVRPGMTSAQARAILPALQVQTLDEAGELADLQDLATQLLRVSPQVAALPPDSLVVEISRVGPHAARASGSRPGAARPPTPTPHLAPGGRHAGAAGDPHLAPGGRHAGAAGDPRLAPGGRHAGAERALVERVRLRLEQLGHVAHVVVADDPRTALACAAWGRRTCIVPPGQSAHALAALPIHALELPGRETDLLLGLGVRTVGAFAALPPASVVGRLGPVAVAAHALARGQGQRPTVPTWRQDEPLVLSQLLLHPVVEQEALLFVLNALLRDGAARLAAADRAVSRVVLRLALDPQEDEPSAEGVPSAAPGGGEQELSVRLGAPTRDPRHMLHVLRTRLESLRLAGPVLAVTLELPEPREFTGRQRDLLDHQRAAELLDDVVARLQDELGVESVLVPRRVPRHRPEAAWQPAPYATAAAPAGVLAGLAAQRLALAHPDALGRQRPDGSDPVREWEGFAPPPDPLRPSLLHHPPVALEVRTTPARPGLPAAPAQVHLDGRWQALDEVEGPEHISCEWWREEVDRACWRVRLPDGRRLWLYEEDQHWALHGSFD